MSAPLRGKIKKAPAEEIVEYLIRPGIATDLSRSYQTILSVNKAHVIMLAEEAIIEKDAAQKILAVTREMESMQVEPQFEITPDVEDLYFNLERYLIKRTGIEIGGQQHTARSRNDMLATITRMDSRAYYLKLCGLLNGLRNSLLGFAEKNVGTVFAGYTHLQPSEPITMGHYCAALLHALERDYVRIANAYHSLNICPLGGCAMASTSFPINRDITAKLLGFDAPMRNSIDAVASRDYVMEIVGAFAIMTNNLSRLAQDLYIWSTPEYDYVEVDDSVAVCSSIMPQKKNPITLEHIKAKAAHLEGIFISVFSALKNTPYTHARDISAESVKYYWTALQEVEADLKLANVTIRTLKVKEDQMLAKARENFCSVTELANYLVRFDRMSFRAAHEVVALVVDHMLTHHKKSNEIDKVVVNEICQKLFGMQSALTDEQISDALDPVRNVQGKKAPGGSSPAEVAVQLERLRETLQDDEKELAARLRNIEASQVLLNEKVNALLQA